MKALTLTEPWASLVAIGAKRIETRNWATAYRGPIAIHAAKGMTEADLAIAQSAVYREALKASPFYWDSALVKHAFHHTRGKVIATGRLVGCFLIGRNSGGYVDLIASDGQTERVPNDELPFGGYEPGRYGWVIVDVGRIPDPIPARGALGLWEWSPPKKLDVAA